MTEKLGWDENLQIAWDISYKSLGNIKTGQELAVIWLGIHTRRYMIVLVYIR